jgi:hypothetical protein
MVPEGVCTLHFPEITFCLANICEGSSIEYLKKICPGWDIEKLPTLESTF